MQRKSRPTMMDVAARAGVSQATVSLILNGSPGAKFSAETVRRVHRTAEELGYRLARRAEPVPVAEPRTILFVTDENASDPWMPLAFEGARTKAQEFEITAVLAVGDTGDIGGILAQFDEAQLVGLIYGTALTRQILPVPALRELSSVLVNCYVPDRQIASVLPGDVAGGRQATEHLIRAGRRRIAIINGQTGLDASRDRLRGYRQALSSHDLDLESDLMRPGNWEPSSGYEQTLALMALDRPPDAIFCANDLIAMGCYDALRELGRTVPGDVAVIGFDDREIARYMRPALTTFQLPQFEMGEIAVELLIDRDGRHAAPRDQIKVECTMIERDSV